jgi:CubicO group peptidase (beta-lactamase class C family)
MQQRGELWALVAAVTALIPSRGTISATRGPPVAAVDGPGLGEWATAEPGAHGLSAAELGEAATELSTAVPVRECFLVTRHGLLMHESYAEGLNGSTPVLVDSIGKTMTALIVGAAAAAANYTVDIDAPIHSYGVEPAAGVDWGRWWPNITTRHLLSQTTGMGKFPPGSAFTYDSDSYISHLAPLIEVWSGMTPRAFAVKFATALGVPHLYDWESSAPYGLDPDHFEIGGGQPMTCRDIARIGQLILNRGRWGTAPGAPARQLVPVAWVRAMTAPSVPSVASSYGFLTYNNLPPPSLPGCCSPRWSGPPWTGCPGYAYGRNRNMLSTGYIGDDIVGGGGSAPSSSFPRAPPDLAISVGNMAKYRL